MTKYDDKLGRIRRGTATRQDFIIADAKDADMGSGVSAAWFERSADGKTRKQRSRDGHLAAIEEIVRQGVVDIMLVSASNLELLSERGVFAGSDVKPVVRANDASDAWGGVRHGTYSQQASVPFRSANLSRVMYGTPTPPAAGATVTGTDLGLYSVTFANDAVADTSALEVFARFREDAAAIGFKYFLEVFNPIKPIGDLEATGEFVNDCILRSLAGVSRAERPQFLKIPYNGPKALEELSSYDPQLVVGILGGGSGTTRDVFELIYQGQRYGAWVALFGRKINHAELPTAMVAMMRRVADGDVMPEEATRAYHGELQQAGIAPLRDLATDNVITEQALKGAST